MIKQLKNQLCTLAILSATSLPSMAADNFDVKVSGKISPPACTPVLSNGGVIDYGTIMPATLNKDDYTLLDIKTLDLTITCSSPLTVAIDAINGRLGTLAGGTESGGDDAGFSPMLMSKMISYGSVTSAVGLGLAANGAKIGGYGLAISRDGAMADGASVVPVSSADDGVSWKNYGSIPSLYVANSTSISTWSKTSGGSPVAFTTLTTPLRVQAYINKASELDLSQPIHLDGLTTLELVYQ